MTKKNAMDQESKELDSAKELRKRNVVLAMALFAFVVLVFFVSIVKLSGN